MTAPRASVPALVLLVASLAGCRPAHEPTRPPNIVFILADDLGWRDLGYAGSPYYRSPRIDALAAQGMRFTQAYANAPNCAPTRAALLSGQYAPRHGVYTVGTPERGEARFRQLIPTPNATALDTGVVTMAEALREAGYRTAHFGKWHLGGGTHAPEGQGFDVSDQAWWGANRSHFSPDDSTYMADYLTDRAVDFIADAGDASFFLYLAHYGVHTPIEGKPALIDAFRDRAGAEGHVDPTYAAMIASVDESVGRVLDALEAAGLADNTLVVFFSDNGGYGPITSMQPLRGAKGMLYEGGIRVPMIVRWPGVVAAGSASATPVIGTDFYPTFLAAADAAAPAQPLDGVSLLPVLHTQAGLDREALYFHFPAYLEAYRDMRTPWRTTPAGAMRSGRWKLIEFFGEGRVELYDLAADPGETTDLAAQLPDTLTALHQQLQAWRTSVDAPVPTAANPAFDAAAYEAALAVGE